MSTPVEQIKERLGIAEVVGSYLKLERAGGSLKAKCPFHSERTASFFVSPARGSYYCFGCQAKGDIFSFVQEFEGLDFVGALRVLASRAGVELRRVDPKVRSENARLFLVLEKATRFFEAKLAENAEAKAYLATRGLLPATHSAWRVGFAPNDWRKLFEHLLKEGCRPDEMEKVGLIKRPRADVEVAPAASRQYYDAFRGRVMFPIFDSASRVIAFSGRILPAFDDGKTGKYINSPETVLFNKSETLYGFDRAKFAIRQNDAAILVEGQMDLLMAHQAGFTNTVASSGTALTLRQLERLKRLSENLLIAFDADGAGEKAAERAIHLALGLGLNVKVIALSEKDPAELIQKEPKEWARAVKEAKHIVEFLLDAILAGKGEIREKALRVEKKLLPLLRLLSSSVEQAHFIKVVSERASLREDALWESFKKLPAQKLAPTGAGEPAPKKKESRSRALLRRLFGMLFFFEMRKVADTGEKLREILQEIIGGETLAKAQVLFEKERDELLTEAELLYGDGVPSEKETEELRHALEEEWLAARLQEVMARLTGSERVKDTKESARYLGEAKALTERLSSLKSARFANQ